MFCTECGHQAAGKFCANCGTPVGAGTPAIAFNWRESCDYDRIVQVPEVRKRIAEAKAKAGKRVSGSAMLGLVDAAASPLMGGLSSLTIAKIAQPLGAKLGLKTGKEHGEYLLVPPGEALANLAVALASIEHELTSTTSGDNHCTLEATLPADLRAMESRLSIKVHRVAKGTHVTATATVDGQWYDWGRCKKGLDQLFAGLRAA
ncbi:hypothetical protein [Aeoliella sp. SH292]|uniref:hypothetical protein n=1 Tax=Aeoliella sp. SH292 TaxID=3454464 RepID=UPI003F9A3BBB